MHQDLYSPEQVASLLGLHVRTVRAYVRDGRLKATRIGKQYRIARQDVEALTGGPVRRTRNVETSSIVEIDALSPEAANRITNHLMAAATTNRDSRLAVRTIYDEERARLKVILSGDVEPTAALLNSIAVLLEA